MPRSHHYDQYEDEEERVICPYNKEHHVPVSQIHEHLAKCRKLHNGVGRPDAKAGPFNRNRNVGASKYDGHVDNCADSPNLTEDVGFDRGGRFNRSMPREHTNGHGRYEREDAETESKSRFAMHTSVGFGKSYVGGHSKQSGFDGRHGGEQFAAPKGFKVEKGFGFSKAPQDTSEFVRDRVVRHSREDNDDRYEESASYGNRQRKPYIRSKSNLDSLDEDSIRRAQRNAVNQVREFQSAYGQRNHRDDDDECERFTKLREPPQQRIFDDAPPGERSGGYGRGRKIVDYGGQTATKPPGGGRIRSEEDEFIKKETTIAPRFTILKASNLFGPVEVAEPAHVGKGFSSIRNDEEDWGSNVVGNGNGNGNVGGMRKFQILKASDVFRLDSIGDSCGGDRRMMRRDDNAYFANRRGSGLGMGMGERRFNRRFDDRHSEEAFANGSSSGNGVGREMTKPSLPWPYNRFAENPNLGKRVEDESSSEAANTVTRKSPEERNEEKQPRGDEMDESESIGVEEEDMCEVMSNAETVSSGGLRSTSRRRTDDDEAHSESPLETTSAKPKLLSIYDQYEQYGGLEDEFNFLKPADNVVPFYVPDATLGSIFTQFRNFGVTQSPAYGSSHSSSPFSSSMAP